MATPHFLGTVAGAVASGRVPLGLARGDIWGCWWNPTSTVTGVLAPADYLTHDAERSAPELVEPMRRRAPVAGVAAGVLSAVGLLVLRTEAPTLFAELTGGPAGLLTAASAPCGLASLGLLVLRRYVTVRLTAAATVTAVMSSRMSSVGVKEPSGRTSSGSGIASTARVQATDTPAAPGGGPLVLILIAA